MKPLAGEAVALFISLGRSTARPGGHNVGSPRRAHSPLDHHRRRHRARAGGDAFARRFRRPAHRPGRGLPGVQRALPQLPLQVRSGRLRVRRAPRRGVRGRRVRPLVCTQRRRSRGRTSPRVLPPHATRRLGLRLRLQVSMHAVHHGAARRRGPPSRQVLRQVVLPPRARDARDHLQSRLRRQRRGARPLPSRTPPRLSLDRVRPSPARNRARLWLVNAGP